MTRHDLAADVLGGLAGGALVSYWLLWSAGRLVDPSRIYTVARQLQARARNSWS